MMIGTERLLLRPFPERDAEGFFEYLHRHAVNRFACMKPDTPDDAPLYETTYQYAILKRKWEERHGI